MKNILKKINIHFDYFILFQKTSIKYLYIGILLIFVAGTISYLSGYSKRENEIIKQHARIEYLEKDTNELRLLLNEYTIDIDAYNNIINDKDYMRYIAFKHSNITIPKHVPKEDLKLINRMCEKYKIPQEYIWRLINKESRYNPSAKSHKGASGYMQIMPATYKSLYSIYTSSEGSLDNYTDNQKNLILGIFYLRRLHNMYNDWTLVLAAYNAGPGNVNNAGKKVPEFKETKNYVKYIKSKK